MSADVLQKTDLANTLIDALLSGDATAPAKAAASGLTYDDFKALVETEYKIFQLDENKDISGIPVELGLSESFIASARKGFQGYPHDVMAKLDMADGSRYAYKLSPRSEINLFALRERYKPLLSPFTGEIHPCRTSLGREWYLLKGDLNYCLVSELSQPMTFMGVEGMWVFPRQKVILWFWNGYGVPDLVQHVAQLFSRLAAKAGAVANYLASDAGRKVALTDFTCPHVCHNFWNVMTGWSNVLEYAGNDQPDLVIEYTNQNFYGLVDDLFRDCLRGQTIVEANDEDVFLDTIIAGNALALTVKDDNISDFFTKAVLKHAYASVSPEFLAEVKAFKADVNPLILVTIRLDNRAWVNQAEGWIGLINKLRETFPKLGVMFDGLSSDSVKGWTTGWMSLEAELDVANTVKAGIGDTPVIYGVGRKFFESIVLCDHVDAFIAPIGSGMTIYKWVTNTPGIAISNRTALDNEKVWHPLRVWDYYCQTIEPAQYLPIDKVEDVEDVRDTISRANFRLDWKDLHDFTLPFLLERFPNAPRSSAT